MSSFWDEFKKLFQTNQQREEEKAVKVKDALKNEEAIAKRLKELEEEYRSSLPKKDEVDLEKLFPSKINLEKINYDALSDDEIKEAAQTQLLYSLEKQKKDIFDSVSSQRQNIEKMKNNASEDAESSIEQLDRLYSELKNKAEKDALKRGLGRSSIITSQLKDYDLKEADNTSEIQKELLKTINDADFKLAELENEKNEALELLDIKHAGELQKAIKNLTDERDANVLKYKKYNDEVEQKQNEYQVKRQKDIEKYLSDQEKQKLEDEAAELEHEKKYGYSGEKQKNYSARYDIAFDFYNSLSPDIAADALAASPNMKYYLGIHYDKLMDALKKKGSKTDRYY